MSSVEVTHKIPLPLQMAGEAGYLTAINEIMIKGKMPARDLIPKGNLDTC